MADNVSGKKIKELDLTETLADDDDFVVENTTPVTMRIKWAKIVEAVKSALGIDSMQNKLEALDNTYVSDKTLYMGSTAASVSEETLIIGGIE